MAVPRTVGRYELVDELGRGGMGSVHRAWQPSLGRMVAIKTLLPGYAGDREVETRFKNEAGVIALLAHENIVRIHDILEEADGTCYIVMELVGGPSLRRVMDGVGALPPARAADLARQAAEALALAHSRGVIHRDIKPANLLLSTAGTLKVMDFGIAKIAASKLQTVTGIVLGTPAYMSPEQAMGETVDGKSDLYSLATVLFELLTGRRPFLGEDAITLALQHISQPPPDPRELTADVPAGLAEVVLRGLAKRPAERFASAAEMAAALHRHARGGRGGPSGFARAAACPRCGAPVRADHDACPACAAALASPCPCCREHHHAGYLACPYCWHPAAAHRGGLRALAPAAPPAAAATVCAGCGGALASDFLRCPFCGRAVPEGGR